MKGISFCLNRGLKLLRLKCWVKETRAAVAGESFLGSLPFDQSLEKGVRDGQEGEEVQAIITGSGSNGPCIF